MLFGSISFLLILFSYGLAGAVKVFPGDDLQAVLSRGEDLEFQKGAVYKISTMLQYTTPGQRIYTKGAEYPSEYATACIGKWHLGFTEEALPNNKGMDDD